MRPSAVERACEARPIAALSLPVFLRTMPLSRRRQRRAPPYRFRRYRARRRGWIRSPPQQLAIAAAPSRTARHTFRQGRRRATARAQQRLHRAVAPSVALTMSAGCRATTPRNAAQCRGCGRRSRRVNDGNRAAELVPVACRGARSAYHADDRDARAARARVPRGAGRCGDRVSAGKVPSDRRRVRRPARGCRRRRIMGICRVSARMSLRSTRSAIVDAWRVSSPPTRREPEAARCAARQPDLGRATPTVGARPTAGGRATAADDRSHER